MTATSMQAMTSVVAVSLIPPLKASDLADGSDPSSVKRMTASFVRQESSTAKGSVKFTPARENFTSGAKPAPLLAFTLPGVGRGNAPRSLGSPRTLPNETSAVCFA